jgi:formylglycine-generating enzyme required for sulfatase activity
VYREETTDAGSFAPNAWGLFDLHGNVWEWCADAYGPYTGENRTDPEAKDINSDNSSRVLRGGSWGLDPQSCRAAGRCWDAPDDRDYNTGFRVCFRLD